MLATQNISLTFETKCYERDWRFLIRKDRLKKMIDFCSYPFNRRVLYINNVRNPEQVQREADKLISNEVIDAWYMVGQHAERALEFFNIDPSHFNGGYYYSIAELVGIFLCETDYLLHFSGDTIIESSDGSWIRAAILLMEENRKILTANPMWDFKPDEAEAESHEKDENWYYSYGFSDQCYMIRREDFRKDIYREQHPDSERYPVYGGELFEKRVDAYMRNHQLERITSKHTSYIHKNIPKNWIKRIIRTNRGTFLKPNIR